MALVVADRVKETSTTTGTGAFTLAGAVAGYQAFSVIGNGNTTYYAIVGQTGTEWEVGLGTYTSAGTSLSRDTILSSSNSNALVPFSAGTKDVFVTYPAGRAVYQDTAGLVALSGTVQATTFQGGSASITNANINSAGISALTATTFSGGSASITNASIASGTVTNLLATTFTGGSGSITTLTGSTITFTTSQATTFEGGSASITNADIGSALIGIITNTTFTGGSGSITTLTGSSINFTTVQGTTIIGGSASITNADIGSALIGIITNTTFSGGSASITTLSGSSLNFSNVSSSRVDGTNPIGYLNVPVVSQSAAYSLVLSDSGKVIFHPSSDANNRTYTIPSSTTVAYPLGTILTFSNLATANPVTIAIITDTLYLAGTGSTGSRTLGAYGIAQATKVALGIWVLTGTGVS